MLTFSFRSIKLENFHFIFRIINTIIKKNNEYIDILPDELKENSSFLNFNKINNYINTLIKKGLKINKITNNILDKNFQLKNLIENLKPKLNNNFKLKYLKYKHKYISLLNK